MDSQSSRPEEERIDSQSSRPTAWIVIAGLCALAAIGLGIWGFTTKSDLDDANATIDKQRTQLAAQAGEASQTERRLQAFGERERAAFRRVRLRLNRERAEASELQKKIKTQGGELDAARTQAQNAEGAEQKEAAEAAQVTAERNLAVTCSQGALEALGKFFDSANPQSGARKAVNELEAIQSECQKAVSSA